MSKEEVKWLEAARGLFSMLSGHGYDEVESYGEFWSELSNESVLEKLQVLCQYFSIDDLKLGQFLKDVHPCNYCGKRTGDVEVVDGEHVCKKCLEETSR